MKRKHFLYIQLILLSLLLIPNYVLGQQWYYFDGYINDIDNGSPVVEHPVALGVGDSVFISLSFTDNSGYYLDSLFGNEVEMEHIWVSTFDCNGMEHIFVFEEPDLSNRHDFEVCTNAQNCQAYYFFEPDEPDELLIYFQDFSEGNIDKWTWEFGDGTSSNLQNPVHQFDAPGLYEVCLMVESTEDSCYSQHCEDIIIGDNGCTADFNWETAEENPLIINFVDLSSENIVYWDWDFDDGTFSEEQSPTHEYAEPGEYMVVLFVADSNGYCIDQVMKMVHVYHDSADCEAAFNIVLDTLNNTPFVYLFEDVSNGNISQWFWEFGDGQTSYEQHPQHIYQEGGTYEVCLNISSTPNGGDCFDQLCQIIETPGYFNFGGQVFIDGFTINIDSTDSDNVAKAYLYRRFENQWQYMDEREFWKYGYYWFANKPEGEYLVRADLMAGSLNYDDYAPSYYKESIKWQYANSFYLSNSEEYAVNIELEKLTPLPAGIGSLSGYLQPGVGCSYSIQMQNQLVQLFNGENKLVAFTYTDETAYFDFNGLAYGQYGVKAEFTGNSSSFFTANLTTENPNVSDIELIVDCRSFVGMEEYLLENSFKLESVYPQPAVDYLNLKVASREDMHARILVYDLNGHIVLERNISLKQGGQQFRIAVNTLKPGLYLLKLLSVDGKNVSSQKIIINP